MKTKIKYIWTAHAEKVLGGKIKAGEPATIGGRPVKKDSVPCMLSKGFVQEVAESDK